MNLENDIIITLDKGKKKIKSSIFRNKDLERNLAIHECITNKNYTSITDVKTGLRLCDIQIPVKSVKENDVERRLEEFIRHFTLIEIKNKFRELDKKENDKNN